MIRRLCTSYTLQETATYLARGQLACQPALSRSVYTLTPTTLSFHASDLMLAVFVLLSSSNVITAAARPDRCLSAF